MLAGRSFGLTSATGNTYGFPRVVVYGPDGKLKFPSGGGPPGVIPTLQQVVNAGNGITNFGGGGVASIQSTNFTNNRTLYLNDNAYPTIRLVDNLNAANYLQIDVDTLNIDGVSYNWSSIVAGAVTPAALTKTDDTNVTLTLGGTPATALLQATSLTLGWTGTLATGRGGTGLSAIGTSLQYLRVNAGGTALEYATLPTTSGDSISPFLLMGG